MAMTDPGTAEQRKRYIVLYTNVFAEREWHRFGCEHFANHGYDVLALECINIIFPGKGDALKTRKLVTSDKAMVTASEATLRPILESITENDLVLMVLPLTPETAWIFRLFARMNVRYAISSIGILPTTLNTKAILFGRHSLNDVYQSVVRRLRAFAGFCSRLAKPRSGYLKAQAPTWWLRSGSGQSYLNAIFPKAWRAKILPTHAFDGTGEPVGKNSSNEMFPGEPAKPFAVFLDAAAINHPEWSLLEGGGPITAENYYPDMNRVFDYVEKETGLEVVIAAHPRAGYTEDDPAFNGREMYWGKTAELIRGADLVLSHHSTAVSLAVHHRKPIVFLTSDEYDRSRFRIYTAAMHSWLNQPLININRPDCTQFISIKAVDKDLYHAYENEFVVERNATMELPWETLRKGFEADMNGNNPD